MKTKYGMSKKYMIIHMCLILFGLFLIVCRWINSFNQEIMLLPEFIMYHVTNFAISLILVITVGLIILLAGGSYKTIVLFGLLMVMANLVCEIFMGMLNTPDLIDALSGIIGTAMACIYLYYLKKNGLIDKQTR